MAEAKPVIQVKGLYKIYKVGATKVYALAGVDFTIRKGEFCAIVGPSGSGKSTLLNMLAGLEKPTKGEIVIAGRHIEKMTENQLVAFRREHVGFIFQSYNLLQTLNAVENVALPLSFRGIPKKARNAKAAQYLKLVGLERQMKHRANEMSGGQQQRVGIARALAVDPEIIFADEPTGNLDTKTTMEVLRLMQKIVRERKQTLIMVTHDNGIAAYADRQFHIVDGKILKIEERKAGTEGPGPEERTAGRREPVAGRTAERRESASGGTAGNGESASIGKVEVPKPAIGQALEAGAGEDRSVTGNLRHDKEEQGE